VSEPLEALAGLVGEAWLVGGALRDRLLGRDGARGGAACADYDVVTAEDPATVAGALARALRAHPFALSEGFGAWRVVARDHSWQVDVLPLGGSSIEDDLARRDLTVNAIAQPLGGGDYVDPFGGLDDLRRRLLRMVSPEAFEQDPLRTLRVARLASELDFAVDPDTAAIAARSAPALAGIAPERIFTELKRILCTEHALEGLELMDLLRVTDVVLPELTRLRGIEQSSYHHLDVYDHTRAVLAETIGIEHDPWPALGEYAAGANDVLSEPLADELTRWQALRLGALLHDIAKPQTRHVTAEGRVTFMGHDETGAQIASDVLRRLRASERLCEHVAALARHHLRVGFMVHAMPLERRAIYSYLRACGPVGVDVTVLSVADRLATRGAGADDAIAKHLEAAHQLLGEAIAWRADPPRPPLRGNELARALGLRPGPQIGRVLEELTQASFAGEIRTPEDAIERGRQLLDRLSS
jgi:putative nucleotidyltransferase with HDIG domain